MLAPDWLKRLAWPRYDCQQCVGQEYWQGCYCDHYGSVAPGVGPTRWHLFLRGIESAIRDWAWVKRAWRHHVAERQDPNSRKMPTDFWQCVRLTVAVLLARYDEKIDAGDHNEVAWRHTGGYYTSDYGEGRSWDYCAVEGLRYKIGDDGSL